MTEKLRECFSDMVVYKDLKKTNFFSTLGLPSFLRDWLLGMFCDEDGNVDMEELNEFVHTYLPDEKEWLSIKNRIVYQNERVKLLTKVTVDINISTAMVSFSLPNYGLTNHQTIIEMAVWEQIQDEMVADQEVWGIVELGYKAPVDKNSGGLIRLVSFQNFCPYEIELGYYKDMRNEFTTSEWIDVLLTALDYNPAGYKDEKEKLAMLTRLLPFVERRLNLIELAPKGTGKSYVFGHVSKFGMLVDGGKVTRAKMFYDMSKKTPGFITGHDYVAIDEVKLVQFGDVNEMRSIMQGYMEYGEFNISGYEGKSDAGVVFLGNIDQSNMDEYKNMFTELPALFQESALLDRIHGFIKGWDIPRMNDDLKVCGWALNSEYFSSILHELRGDLSYRNVVDQLVVVPEKADTRDTEAVKRIATAYLKLLFPNVRDVDDINARRFRTYCLDPAMRMRKIIIRQLGILDKEYKGKDIPAFTVKKTDNEA